MGFSSSSKRSGFRGAKGPALSALFLGILALGALFGLVSIVAPTAAQSCTTTYSTGSPPSQQLTISGSGIYCFDAGTYNTQISVAASDVVIEGATGTIPSQVVIQPDTVTANAANPNQGGSSITSVPAVVYVEEGFSGVTIEGVTISGSGAGSSVESLNPCSPVGNSGPDYGCLFGVVYWGASGEVEGSVVSNVNTYGYISPTEGNGIAVGSPSGGGSSVTISGDTVSNYAKYGIECQDSGTTCTISSDQVSPLSSAESLVASTGVLLGYHTTGTITGNTVDGNACTASFCGGNVVTESQGVGIATNETISTIRVASNSLSGDDIGIFLMRDSGTISPASNTISTSTYTGLVVYDESQNVTGNSFSSEPVGAEAVSDNPETPGVVTLGSNTFSSVTVMFTTQTADGGHAEILPTLTTSLLEPSITVDGSATDSALLSGTTATAGGTVSYYYYSGAACLGQATLVGSAVSVTDASVPNSASQTFTSAGSYSWDATYSGDLNNNGAVSPCEPLTVNKASPTVTSRLTASTISVGGSTIDTVTFSEASTGAGGSVAYYFFAGSSCSGSGTQAGMNVTVQDGAAPDSASEQFGATGSYSWDAAYSGDSNNNPATSSCVTLTVNPISVAVSTTLSASTINVGGTATDQATLLDATSNAGGTVAYYYFSGGSCSGTATQVGSAVTVTDGAPPASSSKQFTSPGTYSWDATYSGDQNNGGSTSPCESLTVVKTSPVLTPSLSLTAAVAGEGVTDSAALGGGFQAGGTATYQYFLGGACAGSANAVGSPVAVTNGVVPDSPSQVFVSAGTYSWDVVYSGDSNNNGATSPCQSLVINGPGVSVLTALSSSTIAYGASVKDSATLSGETSGAGGTVTYELFSGSYCSGPATTVGSTVQVSDGAVPTSATEAFNTPGAYSWDAIYSGDTNNNGATSPCETLTVTGLAATELSVSCGRTTLGVGVTDACTVDVQTVDPDMTGTVTWSASGPGTFSSTSCQLSSPPSPVITVSETYYQGNCAVKFTPTAVGASVTITAAYGGDVADAPSQSTARLTVTLRTSTEALVCTPKSVAAKSPTTVTCTATVSGYLPTGNVTWTQSGSGSVAFTSGTCSLSSGSCSVALEGMDAGSVKVSAVYGGDSDNGGSSRAAAVVVAKAPTSVSVSCTPTSLDTGSAITCTATVSGSFTPHTGYIVWTKQSGKGRIKFSSETCVLSSGACQVNVVVTAPGSFTVKATYSGDQNDVRSWASLLNKASPSLNPALSSTSIATGHAVTDSAYLSGGDDESGVVTYEYFQGDTCSGTATVVGSSAAVVGGIVPSSTAQIFVTAGSYSWDATYSGDMNNNGATSPCQLLAVNAAPVSITVYLSDSVIPAGSSVIASATLSGEESYAFGSVTYQYFPGDFCSGAATPIATPASVFDGVVSSSSPQNFSTAGTYSLDAVYSGDAYDNGATSQCLTLTVKGISTITISLSQSTVTQGGSVYATAALSGVSTNAGGVVTYEYFADSTCTGTAFVVGAPVTVTGESVPNSASEQVGAPGTYGWNAVYSGDASNNAAISRCVLLTVTAPAEAPSEVSMSSQSAKVLYAAVQDLGGHARLHRFLQDTWPMVVISLSFQAVQSSTGRGFRATPLRHRKG